jgi:hypothetical protein
MMHDDNAIARGMHVELDCVSPELDRAEKCGDRVLRQGLMRPPVRDLFGRSAAPWRRQKFLGVVALDTMSAKL